MQEAEALAKQNIKRNFTGRNDRTLSGMLLNSTYSGYEYDSKMIEGFLGVKKLPYARIHEYGGEIKPVRAQKLWLPVYANTGKMTPRDFINLKRNDPDMYLLSDKVAGKWRGYGNDTDRDLIPLFYLVDEVNMPARPYLTPALEMAAKKYPDRFEHYLKQELDK
jgi:phage gpG-like protein